MTQATETNLLLARMTAQPLLLSPDAEDVFTQSILGMQADERYGEAMRVDERAQAPLGLADGFWDDDDDFISWLRPYSVENGILTIPVRGVLMNKLSITFGNYATGYTYIERAFERGMEDPEVHTIAFDIDSPGGEVAGNFELTEKLASGRDEKRILSFANDHAYSAAYSIATAGESITVARSGGVGSVGVVTMHMDVSERMNQMGVKVTFIYAGKHKVDGNPYQKLPDEVKGRIQDRIDRIYDEFVALVAGNRGMEEQAVRDTEALTFVASDAIDVGFADKIGSMSKELAALSQAATETVTHMTTKSTTTPAAENAATFTQADVDQARADGKAEGVAEGRAAEQERISGIFGLEEAKDRPAAARMAVSAGMSVDAAKAALEGMPTEKAEAAPEPTPEPAAAAPAPTPFAAQMDGPGVGAELDGGEGEQANASDQILGALAMATGHDPRKRQH